MNKRLGAVLLLAGLAGATVGCKAPPKPIRFNNMMARTNTNLASAAKNFAKAVEPLSKGQPADVGGMRSAYRNMESALKSAKEEYEDLSPPQNSSNGQDMLDKYKAFLKGQDEVLSVANQIVQVVEKGGQWPAVEALLAQAQQIEGRTLGPLQSVQTKYAENHKLRLGQ